MEIFPASVNTDKKEEYLSPEEFKEVFGMTLSEFKAQPDWKQVDDKKRAKLF